MVYTISQATIEGLTCNLIHIFRKLVISVGPIIFFISFLVCKI